MIRLAHIIAGLELGGVQVFLYRLLAGLDRSRFENRVIALTDLGVIGEKIRALGIPIEALGMRPGVPDPRGMLRLVQALRRRPADLIQTWMYHADLMGGLAARLAGNPRVVWGVHYLRLDDKGIKLHTRATARVCAWLSGWLPARIVCCAEATRQWHRELGYDDGRMLVIHNGVDLEVFRPDDTAPAAVRSELGLPKDTLLVGLVARWDPQKDHRSFLRAAARLRAALPEVNFLLCGVGITWSNQELTALIEAEGLRPCLHLLGERWDMPRLTAALDLAVMSSSSEAYGIVVAEAMACGVPCVVTGVGDVPLVVGQTGRVVPPGDPAALAEAMCEVLAMSREERRRLGLLARRRIQEHFDLRRAVARYQELYLELARPRPVL